MIQKIISTTIFIFTLLAVSITQAQEKKKYKINTVEKCSIEERNFVREIGGDCMSPIGAHAVIKNTRMKIDAYVSSLDGSKHIKSSYVIDLKKDSESVGSYMAKLFIKQGAKSLLDLKK